MDYMTLRAANSHEDGTIAHREEKSRIIRKTAPLLPILTFIFIKSGRLRILCMINRTVAMDANDKPKVLLWVESLLGKGHLPQTDEYANALIKKGYEVHVVSSSFWRAPELKFGGATLHDLGDNRPGDGSLRINFDPDRKIYTSPQGVPIETAKQFFVVRQKKMEDIIAQVKPDAIVTDHYPFARGNLPDIDHTIRKIGHYKAQTGKGPLILGEARDVIGAFSPPAGGNAEQAEAIIRDYYDKIFVMSDPKYCEFQSGLDPSCFAHKMEYVGYQGSCDFFPRNPHTPDNERKIVMAGGNSNTHEWLTLVKNVIEEFHQLPPDNPLKKHEMIVYLSPDYPKDKFDGVKALAEKSGERITVRRNAPLQEFREAVGNAAYLISHAGVNQAIEVLASGVPSLMATRELHATNNEQSIRAKEYAAKGAPLLQLGMDRWADRASIHDELMALSRMKFEKQNTDIRLGGGQGLADATDAVMREHGIRQHQGYDYSKLLGRGHMSRVPQPLAGTAT